MDTFLIDLRHYNYMFKNRIIYLLLVFCFQFIAFNSFAETNYYKQANGFHKNNRDDLRANFQNIFQAEETEEDGIEDTHEFTSTFYIFDQSYLNFDLFLLAKTYICTKSSLKIIYKPLFILNSIFRL